jgi:DNA-binding Lrp family transcriptional regulator
VDKQVLKSLITSNGRISSLALSRQLEIPLTTVQRRRKRLESEFIDMYYVLQLEKLSWRRAHLLISTEEGRTRVIGKQLLERSSIASVSTTIGEHTIDLLAEVIFKDNAELLNIIEWVKSSEGVREVIWTEAVEKLGENKDKILEIISGQKDADQPV